MAINIRCRTSYPSAADRGSGSSSDRSFWGNDGELLFLSGKRRPKTIDMTSDRVYNGIMSKLPDFANQNEYFMFANINNYI